MIKVEDADELQELVSQDLKEFIRLYNPNIFIHKKLYNLLLKSDNNVVFKVYSNYTDKYQLILVSILEFICLSLQNYSLEIYVEDEGHSEEYNLALYWLDSSSNFPLLQIDTEEIQLSFDEFVENVQLGIIDVIKEEKNI